MKSKRPWLVVSTKLKRKISVKHATAIGRAMNAVCSSNPTEATRLIQQALRGPGLQEPHTLLPSSTRPFFETLDSGGFQEHRLKSPRRRQSLGETISALRSVKPLDINMRFLDRTLPESSNFVSRSFACASGQREFRLFIPSRPRPCGLIVMLHGCRQTAEDFSVGTAMNEIAEEHCLLVVYPQQLLSANMMSCWNWFRPQDQALLGGEPEIIAGLTRKVLAEFDIPEGNTYLAGLSAGGAMAAVLGSNYPTLYSAVGIHSGLAYKSAHDTKTAFAAMRGVNQGPAHGLVRKDLQPRLIVFHGSADQTVAPTNATQLWHDAVRSKGRGEVVELTLSVGGRTIDRRIFKTGDVGSVEEWIIHGAGHAWSGGNPKGSFTDPSGPNASAEMVRFFLAGSSTPVDGVKST
jgi:poly(hydroxyalkanoate) depolymerase family esterase